MLFNTKTQEYFFNKSKPQQNDHNLNQNMKTASSSDALKVEQYVSAAFDMIDYLEFCSKNVNQMCGF